jgi:anti-sigma B factor antagonist
MNIVTERSGPVTRLNVSGEMTIYCAQELKAELLQAVSESRELEINLAGVSELDTAGLQLLVLAKREAAKAGKALSLAGHSQPVREVLSLYRIESYFGDPIVIPAE